VFLFPFIIMNIIFQSTNVCYTEILLYNVP
jgi:hypothetical protein